MVRIKQIPEDFVVREIFEKQPVKESREERGPYVWFTLKKTNWDLFRAIKAISKRLGVSVKRFGYAGVKDKRAVTYQKISVWNVPVERLMDVKIKDIELSGLEEKSERINLGDLKENEFEMTIRDIEKEKKEVMEKNLETIKRNGFVNLFGKQRFGNRNNTHLVGREIMKNNLKEAVWIYLIHEGDEREEAAEFRKNLRETGNLRKGLGECPMRLGNELILMNHLVNKPNDYAGALRRIPKKFRRMFVHAYQSYLWNQIAITSKEKKIPVIGFGTDLSEYKEEKKMEKILKEEGVAISDFRVKSMPELSSEGDDRKRNVKAKNLKWFFDKDELNENKMKCTLKFAAPKGSYATVLIDEVLK